MKRNIGLLAAGIAIGVAGVYALAILLDHIDAAPPRVLA